MSFNSEFDRALKRLNYDETIITTEEADELRELGSKLDEYAPHLIVLRYSEKTDDCIYDLAALKFDDPRASAVVFIVLLNEECGEVFFDIELETEEDVKLEPEFKWREKGIEYIESFLSGFNIRKTKEIVNV